MAGFLQMREVHGGLSRRLRTPGGRVCAAQVAFVVAAFVGLAAYAGPQVLASWRNPFQWDLMFITGTLTLLGGLLAAQGFERRVDATLRRLADRKVVGRLEDGCVMPIGEERLAAFLGAFQARAERAGMRGGLAMAGIALAAVILAPGSAHPGLYVITPPGGFFVGYHLGRFGAYGRLGGWLSREGRAIEVKPHHPDGVAGLRPVGELYFRQAMLAAIPAVYLAAWCIVLPAWPATAPHGYSEWRWPYLALLALALGGVAFAFVVPMLSFHRIMRDKKAQLVEGADRSSRRIVEIKAELAHTADEAHRGKLSEELQRLLDDYAAVEAMPTWPVDSATRRRFVNRNLVLAALPLLGNVAGLSEPWKEALKALVGG